jgi:hypothetical protein
MAKGYAIHIGLDYVDPESYDGNWDGKLRYCVEDSKAMENITTEQGYIKTTSLHNETATRRKVKEAILDMADTCYDGDILVLTFSGHGGSLPDKNDDEDDLVDETWCLYDGEIIDDELNDLYARFEEGVRIFVISDSCHSGSVTRYTQEKADALFEQMIVESGLTRKSMPNHEARISYLKHKDKYDTILQKNYSDLAEVKASIKLLSGCQDNQKSYEGEDHGILTIKILEIWDDGWFKGNYEQFHKRIVAEMPDYQTPNLFNSGKIHPTFDDQCPFEI